MRATALECVHELAGVDDRVFFVGSDLGQGTAQRFKETYPDRFLMEGISEANLIGLSAGLAFEGKIPYVNTIATFLTRRCLEQVAVDLCLHNLPVRLIGNGGGMVYGRSLPGRNETGVFAGRGGRVRECRMFFLVLQSARALPRKRATTRR